MVERPENEKMEMPAPASEPRGGANHGLRIAIVSSALILPLAFLLALKPTSARAAWAEFARIIELKGGELKGGLKSAPPDVSTEEFSRHLNESVADLGAQEQAELLVEETANHYDGSIGELTSRMDGWRGRLTMSPRLTGLLESALNSNDLRVRSAAVDMELVAYNLPATQESADRLIDRIETDPGGRPWALWMLGAIGNQGVEQSRALNVLSSYSHDPDEKVRFWAVEGLSLLGTDATIQPLLEIFRNDASLVVRERAGCGLARSGMLTKRQRLRAVPTLLKYGEDSSLDSNTRDWVYQALRNITGARYGTNAGEWREWWAENGPR